MTRLRSWLRAWVLYNAPYKLLALVVAVGLWAWAQTEQVAAARARVKLTWALPEGLVLLEPPLESATASLSGAQAFVRQVRQGELVMPIDLQRAREGVVNIDLAERSIQGLPPQVEVVGISPATLQITLDRSLRRRVAVSPRVIGEVARGYVLTRVTVAPERVELNGPASVLRGLASVPTDEVDISDLREDATFQVGLDLRKGLLTPLQSAALTLQVAVEPQRASRTFTEVPVRIDGEGSALPATATVTLHGPILSLEEISPDTLAVAVPAGGGEGSVALSEALRAAGVEVEKLSPMRFEAGK